MSFLHSAAFQPSTPIISVDAVVLDTETTSRNAFTAAIIQIGAVKIKSGAIRKDLRFDQLIRPDRPIESNATKQHGLKDDDLKNANSFSDIKSKLDDYMSGNILIGHHLTYDLTVLKRTTKQASLEWYPPQALCTRLLSRAIEPTLADHSLEALANWYEIELINRHNAYYDALLIANLFLKFVPLLRKMGIRTLSEAEAISQEYNDEASSIKAAGWETPTIFSPDLDSLPEKGSLKIDRFPYQNLVKDVIKKEPPKIFESNKTIGAAVETLLQQNLKSIVIKTSDNPNHYAVLSANNIIQRIKHDPKIALQISLKDVELPKLETIDEDDFVYRAISKIKRLGLEQLGVVNNQGALIGIVTFDELIVKPAIKDIPVGDYIDVATNEQELGRIWSQLPTLANALQQDGLEILDITKVISREVGALTAQAAKIAEQRMETEEHGPPPCPYCVIVIGEAARGESLFASEQLNAIIYDGKWTYDVWFEELSQHINEILNNIGVSYSQNGIMARNPEWRRSSEKWQTSIEDWLKRIEEKDLFNMSYVFDSKPVYGDLKLWRDLYNKTLEKASDTPRFLSAMEKQASEFSIPLNMFGNLKTHNGIIDLKVSGHFAFVKAIQSLVLRSGKRIVNTELRLKELSQGKDFDKEKIKEFQLTHKNILSTLLNHQLKDIETGKRPTNNIDVRTTSQKDITKITQALKAIESVKSLLV